MVKLPVQQVIDPSEKRQIPGRVITDREGSVRVPSHLVLFGNRDLKIETRTNPGVIDVELSPAVKAPIQANSAQPAGPDPEEVQRILRSQNRGKSGGRRVAVNQ